MNDVQKLMAEAEAETGASRKAIAEWLAGVPKRGAVGVALDRFFAERGIRQPVGVVANETPVAITAPRTDRA